VLKKLLWSLKAFRFWILSMKAVSSIQSYATVAVKLELNKETCDRTANLLLQMFFLLAIWVHLRLQ
jgi:hypothetical protein